MPPDPLLAFDALLALSVVALAGGALAVRDRFAMIVLFIVFGLLSALAWVRLGAPDVALAEAAIGTGLTGALLLRTLRHTCANPVVPEKAVPVVMVWANGGLCGLIVAGLALAVLSAPGAGPGLAGPAATSLAASGVENPVTAVLLNYRAYDTLMEVAVLLAAIMVVWLVERGLSDAPAPVLGPIYRAFARLVLPAMVLVGVYLLWAGTQAPGGAFQGGAVLAAVGLLLLVSHLYRPQPGHRPIARGAFVLGIAGFAAVALLVAGGGRVIFEYPQDHAKTLILLIEALVTISIAATLAALFYGREPEAAPVAPDREDAT